MGRKASDPVSKLAIQNEKYISNCTELVLSGEKIEKIRNFERFVNLEELWLNDNKLTHLNNLDNNFRLRKLYLHNNRLVTLEGSLRKLKHLRVLNLANNQLRDLETTLQYLTHLSQLEQLELSGNPVAEENSYRLQVLHAIPSLKVFDRHSVTEEERAASRKLRVLDGGAASGLAFGRSYRYNPPTDVPPPWTLSPIEIALENAAARALEAQERRELEATQAQFQQAHRGTDAVLKQYANTAKVGEVKTHLKSQFDAVEETLPADLIETIANVFEQHATFPIIEKKSEDDIMAKLNAVSSDDIPEQENNGKSEAEEALKLEEEKSKSRPSSRAAAKPSSAKDKSKKAAARTGTASKDKKGKASAAPPGKAAKGSEKPEEPQPSSRASTPSETKKPVVSNEPPHRNQDPRWAAAYLPCNKLSDVLFALTGERPSEKTIITFLHSKPLGKHAWSITSAREIGSVFWHQFAVGISLWPDFITPQANKRFSLSDRLLSRGEGKRAHEEAQMATRMLARVQAGSCKVLKKRSNRRGSIVAMGSQTGTAAFNQTMIDALNASGLYESMFNGSKGVRPDVSDLSVRRIGSKVHRGDILATTTIMEKRPSNMPDLSQMELPHSRTLRLDRERYNQYLLKKATTLHLQQTQVSMESHRPPLTRATRLPSLLNTL
eukprot:Rmarinus@m.23505